MLLQSIFASLPKRRLGPARQHPGCAYNTLHCGGIHGCSSDAAAAERRYRQDPTTSRITLTARGGQADAPIACSVDLGRAIYNAQAHQGVGGAGTGACSGDLLLGASPPVLRSPVRWSPLPWEYRLRVLMSGSRAISTCREPWVIERGAGRISEHPAVRCPRAAGHCRAVKHAAGENRTVLRGHADLVASTEDRK